jgi:hypothetical protein
MTKQSRLDGVLVRNRKSLMLDLALAAFLPIGLVFSGMAVGAELPKLSPVEKAAPAPVELTASTTDCEPAVEPLAATLPARS